MKESGSQQLLPKRRLAAWRRTAHWGRIVGECLLLCASGFLLAGARVMGEALPLAACLTASLPFGKKSASAALGAAAGYAVLCEPGEAAQMIALTALLLAAVVVFQGTTLPSYRCFLPAMAGGVMAVLGSVYLLGSRADLPGLLLLTARCVLAAFAVIALCQAERGGSGGRLLLAAGLLSGLSGLGLPLDLGLLCGCALIYGAPELALTVTAGVALELTGTFGQGVAAALLLPAVVTRVLRVRREWLQIALGVPLCAGVLWLLGAAGTGNLLAVLLGVPLGCLLRRKNLLRPSSVATPQETASQRLEAAARVLEGLRNQLPEEDPPLTQSETDSVYDGAADRVCRCCARFHRCWQHNADQTYRALTGAAKTILNRGTAEALDFPKAFREDCCHLEGFVTAINQELEGMLYRRRYRMQLRESRQILGEELDCMAEYLRDMETELHAPERGSTVFLPQVGVSTVGRHGSNVVGDRGACLAGNHSDFYVLLCDGMGTGPEASALSEDTVHQLSQLLRAGLRAESALRVLNGVFLLRGTGCFSTVDLLHVDLDSGEAELLKWGAAPSYLRMGKTVKKIGTASPPPGVGVGGDHSPERFRLSLRRGEMLVLVSDGAGGELTENTLAAFEGESPRELAALLIAGLPAEDDMTAVAISLRPRASCG